MTATITSPPATVAAQSNVEQVLGGMSAALGGHLPGMVQLAATVMPDMVFKHAQDSGFAMPKEGGALTEETRTLMLLAIALAVMMYRRWLGAGLPPQERCV